MAKQKGGRKNMAAEVEREAAEKLIPIIEQYGYEVWDIVFEKDGAMWYLKVLFDKPEGGIDDTMCEEITAPINEAVDKLKCIDLIDVLEVGSPGLNRVLRTPAHYKWAEQKPVKVMMKDENGKDIYIAGTLSDYIDTEKTIVLLTEKGEESLHTDKCRRITLDL